MVNRNYWSNGTLQSDWPFAGYAAKVAKQTQVEYIDHTKYSVKRFGAMGGAEAKKYFPNDNTHTNAPGARSKIECSHAISNEIPFSAANAQFNSKCGNVRCCGEMREVQTASQVIATSISQ